MQKKSGKNEVEQVTPQTEEQDKKDAWKRKKGKGCWKRKQRSRI